MKTTRPLMLSAFALCILTAACSNATEPRFSFTFGVPESTSQSEFADVTVNGDAIVVAGRLALPDPCYNGDARVEETGMTITLHLTAGTHSQGACAAVIAYRPYSARILASGVHDVVVVHETVGLSPPPREMTRTRVTVR